jgi:S1-C subfamily serine protease
MPPLDAKERAKAGISDNQTALLVKWINRSEPGGRVAFEAGIREGDILLKVAGESVPKSPQELNVKVKLRYKVGDDLPITILRDGKEREMKWPLVE